MHADEVEVGVPLVRRLPAARFPRWADLPLEPVRSAGTDHALFRLGEGMVARFPRIASAARQVEKEHRWLPVLAPHLPLAVPEPLALGAPGEGYPWHWSVRRWLDGEPATDGRIADARRAATDLAGFVAALRRLDPSDGPPPGEHNFFRGEPLANRDDETREAIASLEGVLDAGAVTEAWAEALRAPAWTGSRVWLPRGPARDEPAGRRWPAERGHRLRGSRRRRSRVRRDGGVDVPVRGHQGRVP